MQREYTEQLGDFCKNMNKPVAAIVDLNMKTFNRLSKNADWMDEFMSAKRFEDVIAAQVKCVSSINLEVMRYAQEVSNIMLEATSNMGKTFSDVAGVATKATEGFKPKSKE